MNGTDTLHLFVESLATAARVGGPLLAVALASGIAIGLAQTVAQVNEASVSFLVKVIAVAATIVVTGSALASHMTDFTKRCFDGISHVVR